METESLCLMCIVFWISTTDPREEYEELPWKPAVQCGWPADQVKVVGFVDGQGFVDITVGVDICRHGAVQRQAVGGRTSMYVTSSDSNITF